MSTIINQEGTLQIHRILIIDSDGKGVDVKNLIREVQMTDGIVTHFMQGRIVLEDQNNLKEALGMDGTEHVLISWKTDDNAKMREQEFFIRNLKSISRKKENEIEEFAFEITDVLFEPMMKKYAIQKHWHQKTKTEIFQDITSYYGITFESKSTDTEKIDYLTTSDDIIKIIEEVLMKGKTPHHFYSQDGKMFLDTYDRMFLEPLVKNLNTNSLEAKDRSAVRDITKMDVYDRKEMFDDGMNGHTLFDFDAFEEDFEKEDVSLNKTKKFKVESGKQSILLNPSCSYIDDYYLLDFLVLEMVYPDSGFELAEKINMQVKTADNQETTFSDYSGVYVVFSIKHIFDRNLKYTQILSVIKE